MKRSPIIIAVLLVLTIGVLAQVSNISRLVYKVDARTIASNGGGTAATLTLTPTGSYVAITCNDPDTCAITMGESSIPDGMPVTIVNMSTNALMFTPTTGVTQINGPASLQQYASLSLIYRTDRWVEMGRSNPVSQAIVTLTDAQVRALPTTAVTIVAAPGSGFRIKVLGVSLLSKFTSGAYIGLDATYADLSLQDGAGDTLAYPLAVDDSTVAGGGLTQMTELMTATSRFIDAMPMVMNPITDTSAGAMQYFIPRYKTTAGLAAASWDNSVVKIKMDNNGTGVLTGGHINNTLKVTVYYVVEAN